MDVLCFVCEREAQTEMYIRSQRRKVKVVTRGDCDGKGELKADMTTLIIGLMLRLFMFGTCSGGSPGLLILGILNKNTKILCQLLELLEMLPRSSASGLITVNEELGSVTFDILNASCEFGILLHCFQVVFLGGAVKMGEKQGVVCLCVCGV